MALPRRLTRRCAALFTSSLDDIDTDNDTSTVPTVDQDKVTSTFPTVNDTPKTSPSHTLKTSPSPSPLPPPTHITMFMSAPKIPKLDGKNYCDWRNLMEDILVLQDLWYTLDDPQPPLESVAERTA